MTQKKQYQSIFSPGKTCNALQYICELLCQKKADFDKVRLPPRFWDTMPTWANYFKKNLRRVAKLLKIYDERAIINVLRSNAFKNRFSLFTDFADGQIQKEQEKINMAKAVKKTVVVAPDTSQKPRRQNVKQGILGKLAELDEN